jgi:RNA polymerase sigma factor (sigma-70 family)
MDADPQADTLDFQALRGGDESALERLMERYAPALYRYALRSLNRPELAREIVQQTFVKLHFTVDRHRGPGTERAWIYRITQNLIRDTIKSRAFRDSAATDSLDREDTPLPAALASTRTPADALESRETLHALKRAIAALPEKFRAPFILCALEELPHQECAQLLGLSPKAVEMRVYKARKLLADACAKLVG